MMIFYSLFNKVDVSDIYQLKCSPNHVKHKFNVNIPEIFVF